MSPFQQAQMYSLADPNIHNLAIDGVFDDCQDIVKAVSRRRRVQVALEDRHGQLDQLGARRRAGRLLLQRLFRGRRRTNGRARRFRRAVGQLRQHPRRARRAVDGPADPPPHSRDQRERRARRILPHRPLPAAARRRDARDVEPVDGHLEGVELRALHVRHGRSRSAGVERAVGSHRSVAATSISPARQHWENVVGTGFVSGASTHADRIATIRDAHARYRHRHRSAHRGRPRRRARCIAIRRCRSSASRPRCRRSSRRRSAKRSGRDPDRPAAYADLEDETAELRRAAGRRRAREGLHRRARGDRRLKPRPRPPRARGTHANLLACTPRQSRPQPRRRAAARPVPAGLAPRVPHRPRPAAAAARRVGVARHRRRLGSLRRRRLVFVVRARQRVLRRRHPAGERGAAGARVSRERARARAAGSGARGFPLVQIVRVAPELAPERFAARRDCSRMVFDAVMIAWVHRDDGARGRRRARAARSRPLVASARWAVSC